jgi:PAS domain-containing protein
MKKEHPEILNPSELRRQAEETLRGKIDQSAGLPEAKIDSLHLIQELEVHQIELEMQNNELQRSQAELKALLEQYNELYDFAPVGYFSLEPDGTIQRANLAGASLLGVERSKLARRRLGQFVASEQRPAFSAFLQRVFSTQGSQANCEICLEGTGSGQRWVQMEAAGSALASGAKTPRPPGRSWRPGSMIGATLRMFCGPIACARPARPTSPSRLRMGWRGCMWKFPEQKRGSGKPNPCQMTRNWKSSKLISPCWR